jgi:hypothetical protein
MLLEARLEAPEQVVLVGDTSFWRRLSHDHPWAVQVRIMLIHEGALAGDLLFCTPTSVMREHDEQIARNQLDNFGIPLWHKDLGTMLGEFSGIATVKQSSIDMAAEMWRKGSKAARQGSRAWQLQSMPGYGDLDVRAMAISLAQQEGVQVYVASYDIKDVIAPLRRQSTTFRKNGWRITPLGPESLQLKYFEMAGISFKGLVTGDVVAKLQNTLSTATYQDYVIFEKNVQSGNMSFEAGVGVVRNTYGRPFELPEEFESISESFSRVPVVRIKSLEEIKSNTAALKRITGKLREFNSLSLVVVDESKPYFPFFMEGPRSGHSISPLLRADIDFFHYQTNSVFGRETYKPPMRRRR